jgi:hypothetical protein
VWANREQASAATGTKAETRLNLGIALRTVGGARLAQNEIEDDAQRIWDNNCNKRPKPAAHPAPTGIAVYVSNQQDVAADHGSRHNSE